MKKSVSSTAAPVSEASDYSEGMRINHARFGLGTIKRIDNQPELKLTVEFDNTGTKVLLAKFAKLTIVE